MRRDIDIKNINRDYLVTVNAKTAVIKAPTGMKFFITDILTCNIFFELEFNNPASNLSDFLVPKEDINNYTLTLRVVKPNDDTKEMVVKLISEDKNFFIADLTNDFTDMLGTYICELFIDATITTEDGNTRQERSTTESFTYRIEKSIFNDLDEVIESEPDYPLLDSLATKDYVKWAMENMYLYGYATREYVNQVAIGGNIDLSDYTTDKELKAALDNLLEYDINSRLLNYATKQELKDAYVTKQELKDAFDDYSDSNTTDLSGYVTDEELANALDNLPQYEEVDLSGYVTNEKLAEELAKVSSGGTIDLSSYATRRELEGYITEQELEDALADLPNGGIDLSGYATKEELKGYVSEKELEDALADLSDGNNNGDVDLSAYATKEELKKKANKEHTHEEYITDADLVAKEYITKDQLPTYSGDANTVGGYSIWVGTQHEYDTITSITPNKLYFIKEDE